VTRHMLFTAIIYLCGVRIAAAQVVLSAPFICQWANISGGCPGNGWIDDDNCGPTSVLMVASKYGTASIIAGSPPDPNQITDVDSWLEANFALTWGYSANSGKGSGTEPPELAALAQQYFGLTGAIAFSGWSLQQLQQELAQGYPVIVRVRPQMESTYPDAHYMLLLGMDSSYVYVNDPGIRNGAAVQYPLQAFIDSWGRSAAWDQQNNEGLAFTTELGQNVDGVWLSFTPWPGGPAGNPGVPGDGETITIGPGYTDLAPSPPIWLGNLSNGLTLSLFISPIGTNLSGGSFTVESLRDPFIDPCFVSVGVGISSSFSGTTIVNGVPGVYAQFPQSDVDLLIFDANYYAPGCNFTASDLYITFIGLPFFSGTESLDALAFGVGQNTIPQMK